MRVAAVLVAALAFGPLHRGNELGAVLNAVAFGVLLAGIFVWRRNLAAGSVAHVSHSLAVLLT